jgi:hypothetical protein
MLDLGRNHSSSKIQNSTFAAWRKTLLVEFDGLVLMIKTKTTIRTRS